MLDNFYDKVAKKFGDYHTAHYRNAAECLSGDPEKVFKEKLLKLSGKNKTALDLGCADGYFTLLVAPYFKKIVAIDLSKGMLVAARKLQVNKEVKNVSFEEQDAFKTNYEDGQFEVIYSRRGPTPFIEAFRLLKQGGYFVEIDIGEQDCRAIKELFGKGQNFGKWNTPQLVVDKTEAGKVGFKAVFAQDYFCDEYYPTYEDLDIFLQGVPIFEDFDSEKDRRILEKYVEKYKTEGGIKLPRHRVVIVFQKP
ncbi:MAG: class I SAM-dependent methyltransferase [Candidatus Gottesmanbacteria bacterium]